VRHAFRVGLTALGATAALAAAPAFGSTAEPANLSKTISAVERTTAVAFIDVGPVGDSLGDYVVGASDLFNKAGTKIGTDHWVCVRTNLSEQRQCTLTYYLPGGFITLVGTYRDDGTGLFAITGGVQNYRQASGWMELTSTTTPDGGKTFVDTENFHIVSHE